MCKWPVWILLLLLPLRLWAGSFMPVAIPGHTVTAPSAWAPAQHQAQHQAQPEGQHQAQPEGQHDCHVKGTVDLSLHSAQSSWAQAALNTPHSPHTPHDSLHDGSHMGSETCHEGAACMACSLCHLSAGLPMGIQAWASSSVQTQAASPLASWLGHAWPPLIKPPIA